MRRTAAVFGIPAALCAAWTVVAGKDLSWDLLHYHYYIAHALLEGRSQDWFAAGSQSYLNPLGYVPFYLMVNAGWHAVVVSMVLAALHGANLGLLYLIGRKLFAHHPPGRRAALSALGAALGGASAVFWTTAGTSFLDPLLTAPMLAAVLLVLGAPSGAAAGRAAAAGILFGAAAALKYSNAVFALAGLVLAATLPAASRRARVLQIAAYASGGALAVAVLAGHWLARLAAEFGNPVFPLFNSVFHSPYAPPASFAAARFAPQEFADALLLPLHIASPTSMIYTEISAPDLRFAALALALVFLAGISVLGRNAAWSRNEGLSRDDGRLLAFMGVSLAAWIMTSANGRYGMLVLLLVGPCLARLADRLLAPRWAGFALGLLLAMQVAACTMISPPRWFLAERWSARWLPVAAAPQAKEQPAIYLMPEVQSMSAVIPFLHPGSSFANLNGQRADSPGWSRMAAQLERGDRPARVLGRDLRLQPDGRPRAEVVEAYDWILIRFGYRVDPARCFAVDWRPDDADALSRLAAAVAIRAEPRERILSLASCALVRAQRDPREAAEEQRLSAVFDRIERECPLVLRGQSSVTERSGAEWLRNYPGLEARIETRSGRILLVPWFRLRYVDLGLVNDWEAGAAPAPACRPGARQ